VVVGKQAARLASQVQAKYRRERVERDRRLERLSVEVLTALGEREAMIAATEQRAGAALQANQPSRSGPASPISRSSLGEAGESQHPGCQRSATRPGR
jgi:hypothetical protein